MALFEVVDEVSVLWRSPMSMVFVMTHIVGSKKSPVRPSRFLFGTSNAIVSKIVSRLGNAFGNKNGVCGESGNTQYENRLPVSAILGGGCPPDSTSTRDVMSLLSLRHPWRRLSTRQHEHSGRHAPRFDGEPVDLNVGL